MKVTHTQNHGSGMTRKIIETNYGALKQLEKSYQNSGFRTSFGLDDPCQGKWCLSVHIPNLVQRTTPAFDLKAPAFDSTHVLSENEAKYAETLKTSPRPEISRFSSKCPTCGLTIRGKSDYLRHKEVAHK